MRDLYIWGNHRSKRNKRLIINEDQMHYNDVDVLFLILKADFTKLATFDNYICVCKFTK